MVPTDLARTARLITEVCLDVCPGDNVLCIADRQEFVDVVSMIAAACAMRGAEPTVVTIEPRKAHFHEPPRVVARAMCEADVVVVMAMGGLMHTKARKDACAAGVKYATLGGTNKEYLTNLHLTRDDLNAIRDLTQRIAERLTSANSAHLTTSAGTDLQLSLAGRKGLSVVPFGQKASFCVLPDYAEATCPPIEDSVEGIAVVDGTMVGDNDLEGVVETPFTVEFKKGRIVSISGGKDARKLSRLLDSIDNVARNCAELGVNSNPKMAKKLRGTRTDNAIAGHVHLGLGRNDHIGGQLKGEPHLDVSLLFANLTLDGVPILKDGALLI